MSTDHEWGRLVDILHEAGLGSLARHRKLVEQRLNDFSEEYVTRTRGQQHVVPSTATLADLLVEHRRNPYRVETLLQAVAFNCSSPMLVMMWLVLLGATIETLNYSYSRRGVSQLDVQLKLPDHATTLPTFTSNEHWDFNVLKLAGVSKADTLPLIESFYPLRLPRPEPYSHLNDPWVVRVVEWVDRYGAAAFCPSVIDRSNVAKVAEALVQSVEHGLLLPQSGTLVAAHADSPSAREKALKALAGDAATALSVTKNGKRLVRQAHFYRRLASASVSSLEMIRDAIIKSLKGGHEQGEREEFEDQLAAVKALLQD